MAEKLGLKYDNGKLRWDRIPFDIIEDLAEVMTYGANKYKEESDNPNWRETTDGYNRYFAAMMRHLVEDRKGNYLDEESGLPHMSHVLFTAVALCKFSKDKHLNKKGDKDGRQ